MGCFAQFFFLFLSPVPMCILKTATKISFLYIHSHTYMYTHTHIIKSYKFVCSESKCMLVLLLFHSVIYNILCNFFHMLYGFACSGYFIEMESSDMWPVVVWLLSISRMLSRSCHVEHGSVFHSFLWLNSPLYGYTTFCLFKC